MDTINRLQDLFKAWEGGSYNAAPGTLVQGAAVQVENLSNVMVNVTFEDDVFKLQKMLKTESTKSNLAQFNRQLSYGTLGGSAQAEGHVGNEETSMVIRDTVPMCYYAHIRRVTDVAKELETFDGVKADDRAAKDAAILIAADIEFDCFRGSADFSDDGVFNGHPAATFRGPNMFGMDFQIRKSDNDRNTQDQMFNEFGNDESVVQQVGGVLTQESIMDATLRVTENFGKAEKLMIDYRSLNSYNKSFITLQRNILAGSPIGAVGQDVRETWTSNGTAKLEPSHFLRGKYKPAPTRSAAPAAPTFSGSLVNSTTTFVAGAVYRYFVTACNEKGESVKSATAAVTIGSNGDKVELEITAGSGITRFYNVYRGLAGGAAGTEKFIGKVLKSAGATTIFTDLNNKIPGFVTGYLLGDDGASALMELKPYSRKKLSETELHSVEAHFKWVTLAVKAPRKLSLLDNIR
jgi:hypothetical protein